MKDALKLGLAFLVGFLFALVVSGLLNKNNAVDHVQLAEYSACLNMSEANWLAWTQQDSNYIGKPLSVCEWLKP
jgi:hypothetical protein